MRKKIENRLATLSKENLMMYRKALLMIAALLALSACNLRSGPQQAVATFTPSGSTSGKPLVTIASPEDGDEVAVGDDVIVSANATDTMGVTRVELLANNRVVKRVSSELPSGERNMNVLLDYTPSETGEVTLQVIAYRGTIFSDPATVDITVRRTEAQVTATIVLATNVPIIDPNDPTCRVLVNAGLNFRTGPGTNYDRITVLAAGTVAPIIGRLGDNTWWQLRVGVSIGWVSAAFTSVYGNCGGIPVVNPPPSPTVPSQPTATPLPTSTPPPTITPPPTATPGLADLVVTGISGLNTLNLGGQASVTSTYAVQITNTGGRPTGQFNNTITLGSTEIALGVVANLDAGQSIVLNIDLSFTAAGPYTLVVSADSGNTVQEFSEVNNQGFYSVTVS
jgi:hypothetical protein